MYSLFKSRYKKCKKTLFFRFFFYINAEMHGVRFSMSGYREQERMTNVPLYGAGVYFTKD